MLKYKKQKDIELLYYKDEFTEFLMKHPKSKPRYAGLARKILTHYLGDLYNPETFDHETELFIRSLIATCVELKVFDRQPYDWPLIDHSFRKLFIDLGYSHLTYDPEIYAKGYNGVMRGELPKNYA